MPLDAPTMLFVDAGAPGAAKESAAATLDGTVNAPLREAVKLPVGRHFPPLLRPSVFAAPPSACAGTILEVSFGGERLPLKCSADALWGYVGSAYLFGGFVGVVRARRAIEEALQALAQRARELAGDAGYFAEKAAGSHSHVFAPVAAQARDQADSAARAWRTAAACAPTYRLLFAQVWRELARAEEGQLRRFEEVAVPVFEELLEENQRIASSEWDRYHCHRVGKRDVKVAIKDVAEGDADFRLGIDSKEIDAKFSAALELRELANGLYVDQTRRAEYVKARVRRGMDEQAAREDVLQEFERRTERWNARREEIGNADPVLIQVYPDVRLGGFSDFQPQVAKALLAAYHESGRLRPVQRLFGDDPLRIEPQSDREYTRAEWDVIDAPAWSDAFALGLTIPASAVISIRLTDPDVAKRTVWLHDPVRSQVAQNLAADAEGMAFFEPGRLEHAAISHLDDLLAEHRAATGRRELFTNLAMFSVAVLLAPFTGGGSLVAAGLLQAAASARELAEAYGEHQAQNQLARATLDAVDAARWSRPSTIVLVRTMAAGLLDIAGAVFPPEKLPFLLDLALSVTSLAAAPDKR